MAWIESHQGLERHPKTKRLASILGISRVTAIGHLHLLWWWALEHAQDGDLSGFTAHEIAEEAMWDGDAETFVAALVDCGVNGKAGFLEVVDGRRVVHDWHDYAGKLVEARKKDADRKREARQSATPPPVPPPSGGRPVDAPRDVQAPSDVTVPYRTEPYRTEPEHVAAPRAALALVHPAPKPTKTSRTQSEHAAVVAMLVELFGTPSRPALWKVYGKVATDLLLSGCDAAEVRHLGQEYQRRWPDVEFTVTALAKHVDTLRRPAPPGRRGRNAALDQIDRAFTDEVQIA